MGLLDFIFGRKKHAQPNRILHLSEDDIIKLAFDNIMSSVKISDDLKSEFFKDFLKARSLGSPREERKIAIAHLENSGWEWSDFDKFTEIFSEKKKWPYMWRESRELYENPPQMPKRMNEAIGILTVADMKKILIAKEIKIKPAPKKRSDFEAAIKDSLTLKEIKPFLTELIEFKIARHKKSKEKAKCELLSHTISMTISSTLSSHRDKETDLNIKYEACDGGCPVEKEYAKKFNHGEIDGLPPFFPGDRTTLIAEIIY